MSSLNDEWLRTPMSELERTLRWPHILREAINLVLIKIFLPWVVFGLIIWLFFKNIFVALFLGFIATFVWLMFTLLNWYKRVILPQHKLKIETIKNSFERRENYSTQELIDEIQICAKKSAWSITRLVALGVPSWGWEIVFRSFYPLLVNSKDILYQDLLIGFGNISTESDQELWEVAQKKDNKERLSKYLDKYGNRTEDLDISYSTLREKSKAVRTLLRLYKQVQSPNSVLKKITKRRQENEKKVLERVRVPSVLFIGLLGIVRRNVALREERRFYYFEANYYIRQLLFELAKRCNISKVMLFNMSWKEVVNAVDRKSSK